MKSVETLLSELDNIHGISGDEDEVVKYVTQELSPYVDKYFQDALGNIYFIKKGKNIDKKIMITAHMDEIGYIVSYIDEQGFVYFKPVGIHDSRLSLNQTVSIKTAEDYVFGVIGSEPSHLVSEEKSKKPISFDELFIDIGVESKVEAEKLGVQIGDSIIIDSKKSFINNNKVYVGKSVDNRVSCAILISLMQELSKQQTPSTIYAVFTVQEEVGIRGAGPAAYNVDPNIALNLDVTFAGGTPNIDKKDLPIKIGKGPAIKKYDFSPRTFNGNAISRKFVDELKEAFVENDIPFQIEVNIGGATDASKVSLTKGGILTGGISIPIRYMHSSVELVQLIDVKNTLQFLKAFLLKKQA